MKNPNDLRVLKTRERLVDAYLQLIIDNVSSKVKDICTKAHISPMTYYHHFEDKTDLVNYAITQQLRHILPIPIKLKPNGNKQLFYYLIKHLTLFFIENKEIFNKTISNIQEKGYRYSYLDIFSKTTMFYSFNEFKELDNSIDIETKDIMIKWFVGGLIVVLISNIIHNKSLNISLIWNAIKLFIKIMMK